MTADQTPEFASKYFQAVYLDFYVSDSNRHTTRLSWSTKNERLSPEAGRQRVGEPVLVLRHVSDFTPPIKLFRTVHHRRQHIDAHRRPADCRNLGTGRVERAGLVGSIEAEGATRVQVWAATLSESRNLSRSEHSAFLLSFSAAYHTDLATHVFYWFDMCADLFQLLPCSLSAQILTQATLQW
jgi:hypothetical protein